LWKAVLEDRGQEHYKRNVEGKASGCARSVDGVDLVGIAGYRRGYETVQDVSGLSTTASKISLPYNMGAMWSISQWKTMAARTASGGGGKMV
jgi:hypothetical protein